MFEITLLFMFKKDLINVDKLKWRKKRKTVWDFK